MAAEIDPAYPLFAPLHLNPYVSSRAILHQNPDAITTGAAVADWLWLDIATWPNENGIQQVIRDDLLPLYSLVWANDGYMLLKPRVSPSPLPETFFTYAQPAIPVEPQYTLSVLFGDDLELVGYDLIFNRAEEVQVQTYWRAHARLPDGLAPTLFLLDERGAFAGATDATHAPATLVWYPPALWPPGEVIVVNFNSLNWYTREQNAYRLALGVSTSPDPWAVGARRRPSIRQTDFAHYLTADGTALELAHIKGVAGLPEGGPLERQMLQPIVQQRLGAIFGAQVRLVGYNRPQIDRTDGGAVIQLGLLWQGLADNRGNYARFVHAVGPGGLLRGQHDSPPANGTYPTSLWRAGEFVSEIVEIPVGSNGASGETVLHIGLYDPLSGQRLLNEEGQDHVEIVIEGQ